MVEETLVCLKECYGALTADTEKEKIEMVELVTKEVKDGDSLMFAKYYELKHGSNSCDALLTCEQLSQVLDLRFKPLFF